MFESATPQTHPFPHLPNSAADDGWTVVKSKKSPQALLREKIIAQRQAMIAQRGIMVQMNLIPNAQNEVQPQQPPQSTTESNNKVHSVGQLTERQPQLDRVSRRRCRPIHDRRRAVRNARAFHHKRSLKA